MKPLTPEQLAALQVAAQPLMQWMAENCHPHVTCIVESERTQLLEGIATVITAITE